VFICSSSIEVNLHKIKFTRFSTHRFMRCGKCAQKCKYCHSQHLKHFHALESFPWVLYKPFASRPQCQLQVTTDLLSNIRIWLFWNSVCLDSHNTNDELTKHGILDSPMSMYVSIGLSFLFLSSIPLCV
jgi:hypothetical protein